MHTDEYNRQPHSAPGGICQQGMEIEKIPERIPNRNYRFEHLGLYRFDKNSAVEEIVRRRDTKPDALFLKECAAYFPGDISFAKAKQLMVCLLFEACDFLFALVALRLCGEVCLNGQQANRVTG